MPWSDEIQTFCSQGNTAPHMLTLSTVRLPEKSVPHLVWVSPTSIEEMWEAGKAWPNPWGLPQPASITVAIHSLYSLHPARCVNTSNLAAVSAYLVILLAFQQRVHVLGHPDVALCATLMKSKHQRYTWCCSSLDIMPRSKSTYCRSLSA